MKSDVYGLIIPVTTKEHTFQFLILLYMLGMRGRRLGLVASLLSFLPEWVCSRMKRVKGTILLA